MHELPLSARITVRRQSRADTGRKPRHVIRIIYIMELTGPWKVKCGSEWFSGLTMATMTDKWQQRPKADSQLVAGLRLLVQPQQRRRLALRFANIEALPGIDYVVRSSISGNACAHRNLGSLTHLRFRTVRHMWPRSRSAIVQAVLVSSQLTVDTCAVASSK